MKKSSILIMLLTFVCLCLLAQGKRVLFIGDSITDGGWGNSGGAPMASKDRNQTDMNHIYGHSYMMLCAAHYQSEYPDSDFQFYNRGIGGNSLYDMARRWKTDALDLHPDIVSILIGTNDIHYYIDSLAKNPNAKFDIQAWSRQYRQLLDELKVQNPKVKIILGTPFVEKEGWVGNTPTFALRDSLIRLCAAQVEQIAAEYQTECLHYNTLFDHLVKTEPRKSYWIWDGIHPTPAGHQRMADLWISRTDSLEWLITTKE